MSSISEFTESSVTDLAESEVFDSSIIADESSVTFSNLNLSSSASTEYEVEADITYEDAEAASNLGRVHNIPSSVKMCHLQQPKFSSLEKLIEANCSSGYLGPSTSVDLNVDPGYVLRGSDCVIIQTGIYVCFLNVIFLLYIYNVLDIRRVHTSRVRVIIALPF